MQQRIFSTEKSAFHWICQEFSKSRAAGFTLQAEGNQTLLGIRWTPRHPHNCSGAGVPNCTYIMTHWGGTLSEFRSPSSARVT